MSLGARATKGGVKKDGKQDKGKVAEKPAPKEKTKPQATTEQLRMANMIDCKSEDASDVRRMVTELMDMTRRTEEEVCSALHDSDNDLQAACNLLLEESQRIQGEWQTSEKKKKKPPAPSGNGDADRDARDRDTRSRSGPRRRGEGESVPASGGGRGRGAPRGRGGSRGGRAAGRGARRGGPPRTHGHPREHDWPHAPDTGGNIDSFPTTEDWDNEEWSGSLSDTKVFTPSSSALPTEPPPPTEDWESGETNGGEHIPTYTYHNTHQHIPQMSNTNTSSSVVSSGAAGEEYGGPHHQPMGMSGSLSAAQTQYLSQFTTQTRHDGVYGYGVYGGEATRKQRARVPPPSKIPSSAVEMPGGSDGTSNVFLDVQFGALEPDTLHDLPQPSHSSHTSQSHVSHAGQTSQSQASASQSPTIPVQTNKQVTSQAESQSVPSHETTTEAPSNSYSNANSMLSESLSAVDATPTSQPVTSESVVTNSTSLDKLSASMKQLGVSGGVAGGPAGVAGGPAGGDPPRHHYSHHGQKVTSPTAGYQSIGQQNVYAPHHVSHHPPVYGANVYAPQVNSTNASLTGASMASGYPSSVTLTQYQPIINSYQQQQQTPTTTVSAVSVSAYGGSALYTAAPYTAPPAHHPYHHAPKHHKDSAQAPQYDSSVASSNSLTSTSTTQTSTAKVATTTGGGAAGAVSSSSSAAGAGAGAGAAYAGGALYSGAYAYDEQLIRGTMPHHMGTYYEVGYGAREGTFGLGAGERFGRTDAASPQQVPAALPPGYAYFYQPPPTSYQYGVYPPYGGGSSVGGVGVTGGAKVSAYTQQQQPPYDAQDSYKPGGPYTGSASKAGGGANDLTNTMYAKTHVALNKVNSYEKAAFHSGTPPPFGAGSHMYIPAPPHHHPHHHAPQQHQMDGRVNSSHRRESGSGARSSTKPAASKPAYSQSYWTPN